MLACTVWRRHHHRATSTRDLRGSKLTKRQGFKLQCRTNRQTRPNPIDPSIPPPVPGSRVMSKMPKKPLNLSVAPAAAAADQAGREMVRSPLGIPVPPVPPLAKARHGDDTDDDEQGSPVHAGPYPSSDLPFRPGTSSDNRPPPPTSKPAPPLVPSISLPPPTKPAQGYARSFFMAGPRSQSASRAPPGHVTIRPVTTAEAAAGPGGHNGSIYALREGADSSPDVSSIHPHQTPELIVVRGI